MGSDMGGSLQIARLAARNEGALGNGAIIGVQEVPPAA